MVIAAPRHTAIKWTYATGALENRPEHYRPHDPRFGIDNSPPRIGDVLVARVARIGRHSRVDHVSGKLLSLFEDDVVGVAFSPRYATRQFQAIVPDSLERVELTAGGGVCGVVVGTPSGMESPTLLEPLGYLLDERGRRVNLLDAGLRPLPLDSREIPLILSVGASMDSGKTTSAYSLINGLVRGGRRVGATKLTGTAAAKDPRAMHDAGAVRVLDFADVGFASTHMASAEQLQTITTTILSHLASVRPDVIVAEIADGVVQRETAMLLAWLARRQGPMAALYSCGDALAVRTGLERLRELGIRVIAVSGVVTSSPLSALEAAAECDLPVLTREQLRSPDIADRLGLDRLGTVHFGGPVVCVPSGAEANADDGA